MIILLAVGGLSAANGAPASDPDEPTESILPTKFPALTANWAAEHCDFIADYRVTIETDASNEYSSAYIALAKEVDRKVADSGGNGYIWLSVGRMKNSERVDDTWDPFVEVEIWDCEQSPRKHWQEMMREHWPELVDDG